MFQFFHWLLPSEPPLWEQLRDAAEHLRAIGVDAVWIPPPQKCASGRLSVGYDVFDHFDLGAYDQCGSVRTKYGTQQQLYAAINALHGYVVEAGERRRVPGLKYLHVYVDVVLNQKFGGQVDPEPWDAVRVNPDDRTEERWGEGFERGVIQIQGYTWFAYPSRNGELSRFEWRARHFDSVDRAASIQQGGHTFRDPDGKYIYRFLYNEAGYAPAEKHFGTWVSLEKGNYEFLSGADIDFGRYDVREELKYWGEWFTRELDVDGVRLDAVKHYTANYAREWTGHVRARSDRSLFVVAEYISETTGPLHDYLAQVSARGDYPQDISLFDFPLRFKFHRASRAGDTFDLRELGRDTLLAEQPGKAVTFVENHDYQYGREWESHVLEWFKPLAYAYILLRAGGYPCIFHADYYGIDPRLDGRGQAPGQAYLQLLLTLRKHFALGEERYYDDRNLAGWVRLGETGSARALAVVVNNASVGVQSVWMDTGRRNRRFAHLATLKGAPQRSDTSAGFQVLHGAYPAYADNAEALLTSSDGWAHFPSDAGSVAIWLEDLIP